MGLEHRHYPRQKVKSLVCVDLGPTNGGLLLDLSEGGLAFSAVSPLVKNQQARVQLRLGAGNRIEARGEVAWIDESGKRGGVQFTELSEPARQNIKKWLASQATPAETLAEIAGRPEPLEANLLEPVSPGLEVTSTIPPPSAIEQTGLGQRGERPTAQEFARAEAKQAQPPDSVFAEPEVAKPIPHAGPAQPKPVEQPRHLSAAPPARPRVVVLPVPTRSSTVPAPKPEPAPKAPPFPRPVRDRRELPDITPAQIQARAEQAARSEQFLRKLILMGIAGCVAGLALAAAVILLPFLSEHIGGAFREAPKATATDTKRADGSHAGAPTASRTVRRIYSQIEVLDSSSRQWVLTPRSNALKGIASMGVVRTPGSRGRSLATGSALASNGSKPDQSQGGRSSGFSAPEEVPRHVVLAPSRSAQGSLEFQIVIGRDGRVQNVRVISGPPTLTPAVIDAVRQWRYHGGPVEVQRRITIDYALAQR